MPTEPAPDAPQSPSDALVEKAKADLAGRLNLDPAEIELESFDQVEWRDGSLGCPRPGMMYTQAIVSGYRILLTADGVSYPYHGATGRDPFLCENSGAGRTPPTNFLNRNR